MSKSMGGHKGFGPFDPIDAVESGGALYIIDGHHRTSAAIRAKLGEVPTRARLVSSNEEVELIYRIWTDTLSDKGSQMPTRDAVQLLSQYASLQGRLVRKLLNLYQPKDRETFRDVPSGTLSVDGRTWSHRRHGAGVAFVDPGDIKVNAHVGMAEFPEGVDGGRLFEYLESIGVAAVVFSGREYGATKRDVDRMLDEMVQGGLLRVVTTQGRFAHRIFELAQLQGERDDGGSLPDS